MTKDEMINIARLAQKVDHIGDDMVTKEFLKAEIRRIDEALANHAKYTTEMSKAETDRLNDIRSVSDMAIKVAYDASLEQAALLAKNVETVASTLRDLVQTTAAASAVSSAQTITPINTRLDKLEAKQYESQGKESISNPAMAEFMTEMRNMQVNFRDALSKTKGASMLWAYLLGGLGAISLVITIIHTFFGA